MNIFNALLDLFELKMQEPIAYAPFEQSWFHYLALLLTVVYTVILTVRFRKSNNKGVKIILRNIGLALIIFEIYKQVVFTYRGDGNWSFAWYAFPFQFCSTAMYAMFIVGMSKDKHVYDLGISFLASFTLFAGLAVMFYPVSVFVDEIGINIQTMFYHGSMAAVGLALVFSGKVSHSFKTVLKGMIPMTIVILMAVLMNGLFNRFMADAGTFNMFFINPAYDTGLVILNLIQPHVSGIMFILIYFIGISLVSFISFKLFVNLTKLWNLAARKEKKVQKQSI